jgi:PadR family transcriptional regulator PadR
MLGRGRRRRGWGCGRRAAGMLESALLLLLHREPAHGYTLLEQLGEFGLGEVDPSTIYRALRDMEGREWVSSTWDEEQSQGPARRVYRITELGDEVLAVWIQDLQETWKMIDHLLKAYRLHMKEGEGAYH